MSEKCKIHPAAERIVDEAIDEYEFGRDLYKGIAKNWNRVLNVYAGMDQIWNEFKNLYEGEGHARVQELQNCKTNTQEAYDGGCIEQGDYDTRIKDFQDAIDNIQKIYDIYTNEKEYNGKECMCGLDNIVPARDFIECFDALVDRVDQYFTTAFAIMESIAAITQQSADKLDENKLHNQNPDNDFFECWSMKDIVKPLISLRGNQYTQLKNLKKQINDEGIDLHKIGDFITGLLQAKALIRELIADLKKELDKALPHTCDLDTDCYGNQPVAPQFNLKKLMSIIIDN